MAGYGLKSFLIAQSLNQIEKAYGANNSILDNCHVRVSFATNDERTAKRVSDALGTATEMRAMKNYAGHRLSPWLGHLMVSRQETARPLLTPGEVMQLPPDDETRPGSGLHADPRQEGALLRGSALHRARAAATRSAEVRPDVTAGRVVSSNTADTGRRLTRSVSNRQTARTGCRQWRHAPRTRASRSRRHRHGDDATRPAESSHVLDDEPDDDAQSGAAVCASRCVASPARSRSTRMTAWSCETMRTRTNCRLPAGAV